MKGTSATIRVDQQGSNIHFTTSTINNTVTTILTVTNAIESYTGYYFVGTPYRSECNTSLTVTASMCNTVVASTFSYLTCNYSYSV